MTRVVTAVVGAGPAGLLFTFLARVSAERVGLLEAWPVHLYDKRQTYQRTHRLRMDPAPYRAIQRSLDHPSYDDLVRFLEETSFRPAVNDLEERLMALVSDVGVRKNVLSIGDGDAEVTLGELTRRLRAEHALGDDDHLTIVGADSVHSTVRRLALAEGDHPPPLRKTHQWVARLKLEGAALPEEVPLVQQLKLSKLIGSIMDYRRHPAGHAEVDLFLFPAEHRHLDALDANPKSPVVLQPSHMRRVRAPLFHRIVQYFREDFAGGTEVTLWSTFRLEHQRSRRFAFSSSGATVFLVGDAAISLPFFRGMASLAECCRALADVHVALATDGDLAAAIDRYQASADAIARRELAVVAARSRLIAGTREFIRLSALAPFPIQTWLLSLPDERPGRWRLTAGVGLNLLLALASTTAALVAPAFTGLGIVAGYTAASLLQVAAGILYRQTRNVEAHAASTVRRLWTAQMVALIVGGLLWSALPALAGDAAWPLIALPAIAWFPLGLCFMIGLVIYDLLERRWWPRAELDD